MGRELADTRFSKGSWWMWQYSDGEGKPYSWERYHVVEVDGDEVRGRRPAAVDREIETTLHGQGVGDPYGRLAAHTTTLTKRRPLTRPLVPARSPSSRRE